LGLDYVRGLGETWPERVIECRGVRSYRDLRDLCWRTRMPRPLVEDLIRAGATDSFGQTRRDLLWALGGLTYRVDELDLQAPVEAVDLPDLSPLERISWEYELLGLNAGDHLLAVYRPRLRAHGILSSSDLAAHRDGELVWVAGLVVVRQRPPSAKGHVFLTLEDEEGLINLIVRPQVYERYRRMLRNAPLLLAGGRLQREGAAISLLVQRAKTLHR
jgi:error-prone DNA polymerase